MANELVTEMKLRMIHTQFLTFFIMLLKYSNIKAMYLPGIFLLLCFFPASAQPVSMTGNFAEETAAVGMDIGNDPVTISPSGVQAIREIRKTSSGNVRSFNITISIESDINQALTLQESIPQGWNLTGIADNADAFKSSTNEWVWSNITPGRIETIVYEITPQDGIYGTWHINGTVSNSNEVVAIVAGSNTIEIESPVPVINYVTLNNYAPLAGDEIMVTVNATDDVGVTDVEANGAPLSFNGGNTFLWSGMIYAIEGTHSVNVSARDTDGYIVWNTSTSYTTIPGHTGSISGYKVNDINGNGKKDIGEKGISGWNIRIIGISDKRKVIRKEMATDATGFYKFDKLPAGIYIVREETKKEWRSTSQLYKIIRLASEEKSINNHFMNRHIEILHKGMGK